MRANNRVLIVEDDAHLGQVLAEELAERGYTVEAVADAEAAWTVIAADPPEVVLSDVRLPGLTGMHLLERVQSLDTPPSFIVITAFGTIPQAVEALKEGAEDFLTKPLDFDHLLLTVQRTVERRRLREEIQRLRRLVGDQGDFHGMIGRSAVMWSLFSQIQQIGRAGGPVLVTGASGVGKELVARAVHRESPQADGPFVAVNCAGIPAELLESEFFGHAAGAFTGAGSARRGLFMEAEGGSLFLDEISELPRPLQPKLLRILQDGRVRPVGADREVEVRTRIITATNRDLDQEVRAGNFREDLFYRLDTFSLRVPSLIERGEDLDLLIARFLERFATRMHQPVKGVSDAALRRLHAYPFPGNVRELSNALERAVAFCRGEEIRPEHLPLRIRQHSGGELPERLRQTLFAEERLPTLEELERRYIDYVLHHTGGNKRQAATLLGVSRRTLYRRLDEQEGGGREAE